jgi:hypothetical protein
MPKHSGNRVPDPSELDGESERQDDRLPGEEESRRAGGRSGAPSLDDLLPGGEGDGKTEELDDLDEETEAEELFAGAWTSEDDDGGGYLAGGDGLPDPGAGTDQPYRRHSRWGAERKTRSRE